MFETPYAYFGYRIFGIVTEIIELFWMYVICTQSSSGMAIYRFWILKLAIVDFMFSLSYNWLFYPDIKFEYLLGIACGFAKYMGKNGAIIAFATTIFFGLLALFSLNDCTFFRAAVIYNRHHYVKRAKSLRGQLSIYVFYFVFALIVFRFCFISMANGEETVAKAKSGQKPIEILLLFNPATDVVITAYDQQRLIIIGSIAIAFVTLISFLNFCVTFLINRRLRKYSHHVSAATHKLHREFTLMTTVQVVHPLIAMIAPCVLYLIAMFNNIYSILQSSVLLHICLTLIWCYPLFGALSAMIFMTPYRLYVVRLMAGRRKEPQNRSQQMSVVSLDLTRS